MAFYSRLAAFCTISLMYQHFLDSKAENAQQTEVALCKLGEMLLLWL